MVERGSDVTLKLQNILAAIRNAQAHGIANDAARVFLRIDKLGARGNRQIILHAEFNAKRSHRRTKIHVKIVRPARIGVDGTDRLTQ